MKNKKILYITLIVDLVLLLGSSIFINFIAKNANLVSYIILGQIFIGILSCIVTLLIGSETLNKKNYKVMFLSFLEILFVLSLIILNTTYGYRNILNDGVYKDYMIYVSTVINIYIYILFTCIIGLLNLHLFINDKLHVIKESKELKENTID